MENLVLIEVFTDLTLNLKLVVNMLRKYNPTKSEAQIAIHGNESIAVLVGNQLDADSYKELKEATERLYMKD